MPRTTRPAAYGPEYEQLLLKAFTQGRLLLSLPSEQHAKAMRSKLYVYFTALRRNATRPDLIAKADAVALSVSGAVLCLSLACDSWDAVAIRESLGITKDTPLPDAPEPPTMQDQMRSKLAELRANRTAQL